MWVLTIGVLEVNPEVDSIHEQRGRARSALFSRVRVKRPSEIAIKWMEYEIRMFEMAAIHVVHPQKLIQVSHDPTLHGRIFYFQN